MDRYFQVAHFRGGLTVQIVLPYCLSERQRETPLN
jgi:hypothetical protein